MTGETFTHYAQRMAAMCQHGRLTVGQAAAEARSLRATASQTTPNESELKHMEDTSKRDPAIHALGMMGRGGVSEYVTGMEPAGQQQVVTSQQMPKEGPWDALVALGFTRGEEVDDLFVQATLPDGWSKEGSDHAMHSYVLDERGIRRIGVFYKAAFYDRRADFHLINAGGAAAGDVLYGDEPPALPPHWDMFTAEERAAFTAGLDRMDRQIEECPPVYGKYASRLADVRRLLAG